jgi:hypothetical protein
MDEQERLWVLVDPERKAYTPEQWEDAVGRLSDLFDIAALFGAEPNEALLFCVAGCPCAGRDRPRAYP